jgi:hypothetical protein
MFIKDLFSKRRPNHVVVYLDYDKKDKLLFRTFSKFTYSIGPVKTVNEVIENIKKFKQKYPNKLKYVTINTYGRGKHLINSKELKEIDGDEKLNLLLNELVSLLDTNGTLQFATCFAGMAHRKLVEVSEKYGGIKTASMYGAYSLNGKAVVCKCKENGFSKKTIDNMKPSKNGIFNDEVEMMNIYRRTDGEEMSWETCGMAYEYNKIMIENGICEIKKQPSSSIRCVMNYLFNIQR